MHSPGTSLAEIEAVFRAAGGTAYLVATADGFVVVVGMKSWVIELDRLNRTPEQNRAMLAAR
jgi:hypothetical protein